MFYITTVTQCHPCLPLVHLCRGTSNAQALGVQRRAAQPVVVVSVALRLFPILRCRVVPAFCRRKNRADPVFCGSAAASPVLSLRAVPPVGILARPPRGNREFDAARLLGTARTLLADYRPLDARLLIAMDARRRPRGRVCRPARRCQRRLSRRRTSGFVLALYRFSPCVRSL